jgi:hypothetical protein
LTIDNASRLLAQRGADAHMGLPRNELHGEIVQDAVVASSGLPLKDEMPLHERIDEN